MYRVGKKHTKRKMFYFSMFDDENVNIGIVDAQGEVKSLNIPFEKVLESGAIHMGLLSDLINKTIQDAIHTEEPGQG